MTFAAASTIFFGDSWLFAKIVAPIGRILILILILDILIPLVELVRWSTQCFFALCRYLPRDRPRLSA
jgi:hypothetical protein